MHTRFALALCAAALAVSPARPADHKTTNFDVEAPDEAVARRVGEAAEGHRKRLAVLWLGEELPAWPDPCAVRVRIRPDASGGATSFAYDKGEVLGQHMQLEGTVERILTNVLPHEVMHTILAHVLRQPVPRWADEGCAILAEDEEEQKRHRELAEKFVGDGRAMPFRRLFAVREYPRDVMALYSQGYMVSRFLVARKDRKTFMAFLRQGVKGDWDAALKEHYGYDKAEELEEAVLGDQRRQLREPAPAAEADAIPFLPAGDR
jgi:hypothetical protein